jgi:hypothetical protein
LVAGAGFVQDPTASKHVLMHHIYGAVVKPGFSITYSCYKVLLLITVSRVTVYFIKSTEIEVVYVTSSNNLNF